MATSILLVDDHQLMRDGLCALLEDQQTIEIVGDAANGRDAIEKVGELQPDVVLMDVGLPDLNGIEATRRVKAACTDIRVIALSMHADKRYVVEMFKAGASGYLLKNCASDELVRAIETVNRGAFYLSPSISSVVIEQLTGNVESTAESAYSKLTNREREVLQLLAEGKTSKQIAACLGLAVRTIETHRREIMRKLDLRSVAALTKYAIREGLTSLEN